MGAPRGDLADRRQMVRRRRARASLATPGLTPVMMLLASAYIHHPDRREAERIRRKRETAHLRHKTQGAYRLPQEKRRQAIFMASHDDRIRKRGHDLASCGTGWWDDSDVLTAVGHHRATWCGDRSCGNCGNVLRARDVDRYLPLFEKYDYVRAFRVSERASYDPLYVVVRRHVKKLRKLLYNAAGKRHITGAYIVTEWSWNHRTYQWNVHSHVLYVGEFWPQHELSDEWAKYSPESPVVRIYRIKPYRRTIAEAIGYGGKATNLSRAPDGKVLEDAYARRNIRLRWAIGVIRVKQPKPPKAPRERQRLTFRIGRNELIDRARAGIASAVNLAYMMSRQPCPMGRFIADQLPGVGPVDNGLTRSAEVYVHARDPPPETVEEAESEWRKHPAWQTRLAVRNVYLADRDGEMYADADKLANAEPPIDQR